MLYLMIGHDREDSLPARQRVRARHLERVNALQDAGRLVIAGPCPAVDAATPGPAGYVGSLIIAEFDSLEEAEAWLAEDPYVTGGVFARTEVRPFVQVRP